LVNGAVALSKKALAEAKREIVNDFSFLVGEQFRVVPVRGKEAVFAYGG